MGIEEVKAKGIGNINNKVIAESFPNLEKRCPTRYRGSRTLNSED
jgi:hypothetical protein